MPNSKSMKLLTSDALQHRQETFQDSTIQCPSPKKLGSSFQGISSMLITLANKFQWLPVNFLFGQSNQNWTHKVAPL